MLVSGLGVDQLLAVPKLGRGTGAAQADAVVNALQEWDITDRVAAMSFDTTSSNTCHISGERAPSSSKSWEESFYS